MSPKPLRLFTFITFLLFFMNSTQSIADTYDWEEVNFDSLVFFTFPSDIEIIDTLGEVYYSGYSDQVDYYACNYDCSRGTIQTRRNLLDIYDDVLKKQSKFDFDEYKVEKKEVITVRGLDALRAKISGVIQNDSVHSDFLLISTAYGCFLFQAFYSPHVESDFDTVVNSIHFHPGITAFSQTGLGILAVENNKPENVPGIIIVCVIIVGILVVYFIKNRKNSKASTGKNRLADIANREVLPPEDKPASNQPYGYGTSGPPPASPPPSEKKPPKPPYSDG